MGKPRCCASQERSLAEVGRALGASEEAARKRVDRALEKLRQYLARKGITATSGALAAVLVANAAPSVPAGLAPLLASGALSAAARPVPSPCSCFALWL